MIRVALPLMLAAAPVAAQEWEVAFQIAPPIEQSQAYGDVGFDWGQDVYGDRYANMEAYWGPFENAGTACADIGWFEVDFFFGEVADHDIQLLFGLERLPGGWRVDNPAAFLNLTTWEDSAAVLLERYDGARIDLMDLECEADGRVTIAVEFEFSGPPDSYKGPDFLSVNGTARGTMPITSYDEY